MEHFFGKIIDGKMQLSEIGFFADKYCLEIPQHFPFVKLGDFVVMPNHVHGIIIIDKTNDNGDMVGVQNFAHLPPSPPHLPPSPPHQPSSTKKTNLVHNPKIWHQLFVLIKLV